MRINNKTKHKSNLNKLLSKTTLQAFENLLRLGKQKGWKNINAAKVIKQLKSDCTEENKLLIKVLITIIEFKVHKSQALSASSTQKTNSFSSVAALWSAFISNANALISMMTVAIQSTLGAYHFSSFVFDKATVEELQNFKKAKYIRLVCQKLLINKNLMSANEVIDLARAIYLPKGVNLKDYFKTYVRSISQYNCLVNIKNISAKELRNFLAASAISTIYLNKLDVEGATVLSEVLKNNHSIDCIYLPYSKIGDKEAKFLAEGLKENKGISLIDLRRNEIGDEGIKALAEAFKQNQNIMTIYLENNKIGDKGAQALAEALKENQSIAWIDLFNNNIGDKGVKALNKLLKQNKSIITINLDRNKFSKKIDAQLASNEIFNFEKIPQFRSTMLTLFCIDKYTNKFTDKKIPKPLLKEIAALSDKQIHQYRANKGFNKLEQLVKTRCTK